MSFAKPNQKSAAPRKQSNPPPEIVDPRWLLRALAITLAVALLCAYLTACLLFYQGIWQLVLHPSHTVDRTPATAGLAFTPIRFADYDTGTPHLTGWWVPAQDAAPSSSTVPTLENPRLTILYLHGGSGSLADTLPALTLLHAAGLNVFAIDYRSFGASDNSTHPDADRMTQDAAAALDYLVATRHIPAVSIIPTGSGLGASLAVQLAQDHPTIPAVILDNPDPDPTATAAAAGSSRIIPVRLLFGKRFTIAQPLATLATPKLLIAGGPFATPNAPVSSIETLFHHAASPSYIVGLPNTGSDAALNQALHRFLDQYAPRN